MPDKWTATFCIPGTLSADLDIRFAMPDDATLIHVSACARLAAGAGLQIGTPTDADAYLANATTGTGNVPAEYDFDGFVTYAASRSFPRLSAGDVLVISVDYDYNGGDAPAPSVDVTIVLTFADQ